MKAARRDYQLALDCITNLVINVNSNSVAGMDGGPGPIGGVFGSSYCPNMGRLGASTRLMVSFHYPKHSHNLSDEYVFRGWVENSNHQYLSGMKSFEHQIPIDSSSMKNPRKRIGQSGAEKLLKSTVEAGLKLRAIKPSQLKRVNVDTTVQEKEIRFPTDARWYERARRRPVTSAPGESNRT